MPTHSINSPISTSIQTSATPSPTDSSVLTYNKNPPLPYVPQEKPPSRGMRTAVMFFGSAFAMLLPFFFGLGPMMSSWIGASGEDVEIVEAVRALVMEQPQMFSGGLRQYAQDVGLGDALVQYEFSNGTVLGVSEYKSESRAFEVVGELHLMFEPRGVREQTRSYRSFVSYVFKNGEAVVVRRVGRYLVVVEAPTKSALLETSRRLAENNIPLTLNWSAVVLMFMGLIGYGLWVTFFLMSWLARWATRVEPIVGVMAVSNDELRQRLLGLTAGVPLTVEENKRTGILKVRWDYADERYVSLVEGGIIQSSFVIELKLYDEKKEVRMIHQSSGLRVQGNVVKPSLSASFSFFRGIIFGAYQYEAAYGPTIKDGRLVIDKLYEVQFSNMEIVKVVTATVVQSGWVLQPVVYRL